MKLQVVGTSVYFVAVDSAGPSGIRTSAYRVSVSEPGKPVRVITDATEVFRDGDSLRFLRDGSLRHWDLATSREIGAAVSASCGAFFNERTAILCNKDGAQISMTTPASQAA